MKGRERGVIWKEGREMERREADGREGEMEGEGDGEVDTRKCVGRLH